MYHSIIAAYFKKGDASGALEVLEAMKRAGHLPDVRTLNTVVKGYAFNGQFNEANNFIKNLKEQGVYADANTFQAFILAHCLQGNFDAAINTLSAMSNAGIDRIRDNYFTIFHHILKSGSLESAETVLSLIPKLKADKFHPTTYFTNQVAAIFESHGNARRAEELRKTSEEEKVQAIHLQMLKKKNTKAIVTKKMIPFK